MVLLKHQLITLGKQLNDQLVGFGALGIQLLLGGIQLLTGDLQLAFFLIQLGLGLLHRLSGIAELLQAAGIGGGDFFHHVQTVQKV